MQRSQHNQEHTSDDFAFHQGRLPTRFVHFMRFPFDDKTTMEGIRDNLDAGRYKNCMVLWQRGGITMVLELLPPALLLCGKSDLWSFLLRGPPGQLSYRKAIPFATLMDLLLQCTYTDVVSQDRQDLVYRAIVTCVAAIPNVVWDSRWWSQIPTVFERLRSVVAFPQAVQIVYERIIRETRLHVRDGEDVDLTGVPQWVRELTFRRFVMRQTRTEFCLHYPAQTISTGFKGAIDALVTVQNHYGLVTHGSITLDADIIRVTKFRRGNSVGVQRRRAIEEDCYLVRKFNVFTGLRMHTYMHTCIENLILGIVSIIQELLKTQGESATDWTNATPVDWQQDLAQRLLDSNGNRNPNPHPNPDRKWKYLSGLVG